MFAVGVNSNAKDFLEAVRRPEVLAAGYIGQFIIKPILGYIIGNIALSMLNLPNSLGEENGTF